MYRVQLIQEIFKKTNYKNYLEVGCQRGTSFLPIKAKYKIAVDPVFRISWTKKLKWFFRNPKNMNNTFFEETSDDFFLKRKDFIQSRTPIDVALLDGLHTYRALLLDVLNTLKYMEKGGIIIAHDCLPPHKAASTPTPHFPTEEERKTIEGWTGEWCGDVWKAMVYLLRHHADMLEVCVLNTDYGLGIVRPKGRLNAESLTINEAAFAEIDKLTYEELMENLEGWLNLKDEDFSNQIVAELQAKG